MPETERRDGLYQAAHPQILLNDNIVDGTHDEPYLCCISGTSKVRVYLLGLCLVQGDKPVQDVVTRGGIIGTT